MTRSSHPTDKIHGMTHNKADTIFLIEGTTVTKRRRRKTLSILSIWNGPLEGIRLMTTTKKSKTFHPFLKYDDRYAKSFNTASAAKMAMTALSNKCSRSQWLCMISFDVSNHMVTQFTRIRAVMKLTKRSCSTNFLIWNMSGWVSLCHNTGNF